MRRAWASAMALALLAGVAAAAAPGKNEAGKSEAGKSEPVSILPGGDSNKPISIEADKLDYFQKEGRAVYDGHVVVVQGDSRLTCARLTIFMEPSGAATPKAEPAAAAAPAGADASNRLKHMDCAGPVKVTSKTQTATSDNGSYDKGRNDVVLTGHVVLTDGRNVTRGERLVYDLATGQAAVQGGGSRVSGFFLPNEKTPAPGAKKK